MKTYKDIHRKYSNPSDDVTFLKDNDKKLKILYPDAPNKWGRLSFVAQDENIPIFITWSMLFCIISALDEKTLKFLFSVI